jgi:ATP-binding cassette subfamily B protein
MEFKKYIAASAKYVRSLSTVLSTAYRVSPTIVWIKGVDAILNATLPVATAYYAGLTTTALAATFTGVAGAREDALLYVGLTAGIALIQQGWSRASDYVRFIAGAKIRNTVQLEIYRKYLSLDYWRYEDKETNDLKDRAERFAYIFEGSFDTVFDAFGALVSFVVALIAVAYSSPIIGFVLLLALLPSAWVQLQTTKLDITWWDANRERNRRRYAYENKLMRESSVMDTGTFGLEHYFLDERAKVVEESTKVETDYKRIMMRWWVVGYVVENGALLFSLVYTVYQIAAKLQTIGHFVFVQSMVLRATSSMTSMVGRFGSIGETITHFKDYNDFMSLPEQRDGTRTLTEPVRSIILSDVTFRYPHAEKDVLNGVTLEIQQGEHVAIVGENGAGKTTLVRLLMGMATPTGGSLELNGVNLGEYKLSTWHDRIGVLFQGFDSYDFASVRDNVRFGRVSKKATDESIESALKRARAYEFVQGLSKKEDTITSTYYGNDDDSTRLSGGQWQRLAIARVFFREPEVLLLDEPTSALDAKAESEIFDEIHKEMEGKTVIIISHRFSTVRKAHKIVVLAGGKIIEMGTHQELMKLKGTYHNMFELQAKEYR